MTMDEKFARRLRGPEELPQGIAPTRDLWPGIAQAIAAERSGAGVAQAASAVATRRTPHWALAVAASVMLVAIGAWMGRQFGGAPVTQPQAAVPRPAAVAAAPTTLAASFALDARSSAERQQRLASLSVQLAALSPSTREHVQASLAAIEKSVLDIQQALGKDPGNLLLQELLVNSYQDEMRVIGAIEEANRMTLEQGL